MKANVMAGNGFALWLTGLPSAGKSTLAAMLADELRRGGRSVEVLDGDEVRQRLTRDLGFSKEDRDENIRRISYVANLLSRNGVVAIVAAISPYQAVRDEARREIGSFVEVYVKCDVEVCAARDVKGMYQKAFKGEIQNFTGVSDPYEPPVAPEVVVETDLESVAESASRVLSALASLKLLKQKPDPVASKRDRSQGGTSAEAQGVSARSPA